MTDNQMEIANEVAESSNGIAFNRRSFLKLAGVAVASLAVGDIAVFVPETEAYAATSFEPAWPTDSKKVNSLDVYPSSGSSHNGIDISPIDNSNNYIRAIAPGKVIKAEKGSGSNASFGYYVKIEHNIDGVIYTSIYAHMAPNTLKVKKGNQVKTGTILGIMGNTGESSGKHLHLSIYKGKTYNNNINKKTFDYYKKNTLVCGGMSFTSGLASKSPLYGSWIKSNCTLKSGRYYFNPVTPTLTFQYKSFTKTLGDSDFTNKLTKTVTDGKLTYASNNTSVAKVSSNGKVTITGVGKVTITVTSAKTDAYKKGTASYTVTVNPAGTSILKLTPQSRAIGATTSKVKVEWLKMNVLTTGYQIQYWPTNSTNSTKTISRTPDQTSCTMINLKTKTKYAFRIRTYRKIGSACYYSAWSPTKYVTTK